jgi:hypothetical protein
MRTELTFVGSEGDVIRMAEVNYAFELELTPSSSSPASAPRVVAYLTYEQAVRVRDAVDKVIKRIREIRKDDPSVGISPTVALPADFE